MRDYIQSMFVRRLLLLAGVCAAGSLVLTVRLGQLTLARGREARAEAEQRLVRTQWLPTVRGRILDRKGRVLAQDRPSYNVAMSYTVLSAEWAAQEAPRIASRLAGSRWTQIDKEQRSEASALVRQRLLLHQDDAWHLLAATLRVDQRDLDIARDRVLREVQSRQDAVTRAREASELAAYRERNETPSEDELAKLRRRAAEPISETRAAHVVRARVSDDDAFALRTLASDQATLDLPEVARLLGLPEREASVLVPLVPGLSVLDTGDREYPLETTSVNIDLSTFPSPVAEQAVRSVLVRGVAAHALGSLRDRVFGDERNDDGTIRSPGDASRRAEFLALSARESARAITPDGVDRGRYSEGDRVGATGIEASQEHVLRGLRGRVTTRVDGGAGALLTAEGGRDVRLTLDAVLQARVQALLDPALGLARMQPWHGQRGTPGGPTLEVGEPLFGSIVVLDIASGDVLSMVSSPSYTHDDLRERMPELLRDEFTRPLQNRATNVAYAAGSIVKPLIYVGAVQQGLCAVEEVIACDPGYFLPNQPNVLQCLIWKRYRATHNAVLGHDLSAVEAIGVSCNIYFYTLGRRLGPQHITDLYRSFGVGSTWSLGAGPEFAGHLGHLAPSGQASPKLEVGDAIQMGIGQGPISWTPMHAADAYATLARGGRRLMPRLMLSENVTIASRTSDLSLPPAAVEHALGGLYYSTNDTHGTGYQLTIEQGVRERIFNVPGVRVWGKTGTATAPPLLVDPDGPDGPLRRVVAREGDHSWFVILAGEDSPRYAIAVVMEYAGSGGKVSGPIVNQVLHALVAEGYLTSDGE